MLTFQRAGLPFNICLIHRLTLCQKRRSLKLNTITRSHGMSFDCWQIVIMTRLFFQHLILHSHSMKGNRCRPSSCGTNLGGDTRNAPLPQCSLSELLKGDLKAQSSNKSQRKGYQPVTTLKKVSRAKIETKDTSSKIRIT